MQRSTDRILTTHCGSLIRTREIIEGMRARTLEQPYDQAKLVTDIRAGIDAVVQLQVDAGIDIPNDGEYGRYSFMTYFQERVSGLAPRPAEESELAGALPWERTEFPEFFAQHDTLTRYSWMLPGISMAEMEDHSRTHFRVGLERFRVVAPIAYVGQAAIEQDITNLRHALRGKHVADAFVTAIAPTTRRQERGALEYYTSDSAYEYAMADVLREEYRAIANAGFIIQIDFATVNPQSLIGRGDVSDDDMRRERERSIELANHALQGIPEESVRAHFCGGSHNAPHTRDAQLKDYVHTMLRLRAQGYGIEGANPRHEHEWMVWQDVKLPDGKVLIPGLITHHITLVEHPELIAWRIKNYASVVGKENVIAGADCGFSQNWDLVRQHPSIQWAKLKALAEGAALASRDLWGKTVADASQGQASGLVGPREAL
jgi:5-methyltetrahydropteroyltriglutamate--homocysteine methyltransferase